MTVLGKITAHPKAELLFVSEAQTDELRVIVAQQFENLGVKYDPNVTVKEVRDMMRADGICPEDNFLS